MSVTVHEIASAGRGRLAALTGETAGYLVLGAADQVAENGGAPDAIYLMEDGVVRLGPSAAGPLDPEVMLRAALDMLLSAGPPPAPALVRAARTTDFVGLPRFVRELEAALIPVNRAAARRALARLHRDVTRAKDAGKLAPLDAAVAPAARTTPSAPELVVPPASTLASEAPVPLVRVAREPKLRVVVPALEVTPHVAACRIEETPRVPDAAAVIPPEADATPEVDQASALFRPETPLPSEGIWIARESTATPFIGSFLSVAPVPPSAFVAAEGVEHDTERAPPVAFDDEDFDAEPEHESTTSATDDALIVAICEADDPLDKKYSLVEPRVTVSSETPRAETAVAQCEPAQFEPTVAQSEPVEPEPAVAQSEPVEPEPAVAQSEPVEPEPAVAQSEPVEPETAVAQSEPVEPETAVAQSEPVEPETAVAQSEPIETETAVARSEPVEPETAVAQSEPVEPEPTVAQSESAQLEPAIAQSEPAQLEPVQLDPPVVESPPSPAPKELEYVPYQTRKSDVAELVAGFVVAESQSLVDLSRELTRIADAGGTPAPGPVAARARVSKRVSSAR